MPKVPRLQYKEESRREARFVEIFDYLEGEDGGWFQVVDIDGYDLRQTLESPYGYGVEFTLSNGEIIRFPEYDIVYIR